MNNKVYLYGVIGDPWEEGVAAMDVIQQINQAEGDTLEVHINSPGGSVFDGIAIFEALNKSSKKVICYIDGLSASMASVIMMAADERVASRHVQIMTHKPTGGGYGTAEELKTQSELLAEIENTLLSIYQAKTGLTEAECRAKFFANEDTWFTAEQALEIGLIDRIEEGKLKTTPQINPGNNLVNIYRQFAAVLKPNNQRDMDFTKIKNELQLGDMSEASFLTYVKDLRTEAGKVKGLNEKVTELTNEVQGYKDKEAEANAAKKKDFFDTAVKDKRLTESERADWEDLYDLDAEKTMNRVNALPKATDLSKFPQGQQHEDETRKDWSFTDWSKNDPTGLETMKAENHDRYAKLFKEQYGVEPKK